MNFEQEKWDEAIADWTRLASKYPNTGEASRAQLMIGHVLEFKQGKLAAALEKRFDRQVRVEAMVDPSLIGGAVVRAGDLTIDGSVKARLARLAHDLSA
jgi:F0F1-type ATP synthase delta subunit